MPKSEDRATVRAALLDAIDRAGSQSALAVMLGDDVKTGNIYYWLKNGVVPERHCTVIEQRTGVSRFRLCPWGVRVWPELAAASSTSAVNSTGD